MKSRRKQIQISKYGFFKVCTKMQVQKMLMVVIMIEKKLQNCVLGIIDICLINKERFKGQFLLLDEFTLMVCYMQV